MDESSGNEGSLHQHPLSWRRSKGECYLLFANMQIAPFMVAALCVASGNRNNYITYSLTTKSACFPFTLMSMVLIQATTISRPNNFMQN